MGMLGGEAFGRELGRGLRLGWGMRAQNEQILCPDVLTGSGARIRRKLRGTIPTDEKDAAPPACVPQLHHQPELLPGDFTGSWNTSRFRAEQSAILRAIDKHKPPFTESHGQVNGYEPIGHQSERTTSERSLGKVSTV